jgi:transcriptional regulator of arginine metabolism
MKTSRHERILELVNEFDINTQEELLSLLNESGYKVTQATVSRDIKELRLLKTLGTDGKYKYTTSIRNALDNKTGFENLFSTSALSIDLAGNILVIKTMSGMAQAVCASMDNIEFENVVGTIAGDDTIFVAVRSSEAGKEIAKDLKKLL